MIQRLLAHLAWPVRLLWIAVALTPTEFRLLPWVLWALVAIATWIHHPVSLTACRSMAPIVSGFVIANSVSEQWSPVSIICAVISIVSVMLMFTAEYGALHVQAGAYGSERRFLLRVPVALLLPLMLAWAVLSASLVVFDELINRQNLVGSLIAGVISALLLWQLTPRIHRLSKRWLVRVPAGWVIHDGMMLAENLLIRSHNVSSISLALHGTEALDLSGVTPGVPYEIQLREMSDVRLSKLGSQLLKTMDVLHVKALLVATSRTPLN